jgi:pyruvate/2-oxoglutarate/acetoin dehydrogenase E1 component
LKIFYPYTPQETFEALVAGFFDPNPCLVFEHKFLYGSKRGDIRFGGKLDGVLCLRQYAQGDGLTVVATGACLNHVIEISRELPDTLDVWNPFMLQPLQFDPILASIRRTGRLLVVQESGTTAGMGDRFVSLASREAFADLKAAPRLVAAPDTPTPFAPELEKEHIPGREIIVSTIQAMIGKHNGQ